MGVVGFAGIIIGFLNQFSDCGVGSAAIRRPQLEPGNLETAFTLKVIMGVRLRHHAVDCAVGPAFLRPSGGGERHPVSGAEFSGQHRRLSPASAADPRDELPGADGSGGHQRRGACESGHHADLVRLEILGGGHGRRGANLAGNLALQCVKKCPWVSDGTGQNAGEFLRFGLPLLGTGIVIFLIFSMDNFLVSATMGIAQLGYYALAMNWGSFVCGLLANTVHGVLFPTFAAIQHDSAKLRRWYLKTVDLVAFIAVVANTALLANAHSFLVIFLGKGTDKWIPAALALQILCLYGIVRAVTEPVGNCLMARNRTKTMFHANLLCGGIQIALLVPALYSRKIEWVAVAVLVSYATQAFIYIPYLRRELSITFADLIKQLWPVVPAMLAGWWATHALFDSSGGSLFTLADRGLFTAISGRHYPRNINRFSLLPGSAGTDFLEIKPQHDRKINPPNEYLTLLKTNPTKPPGYESKPADYFEQSRPEMLRFVPPDCQRVLDVGCSQGNFGAMLKKTRKLEVWGIEPVATAAAEAATKLDHVIEGAFAPETELPRENFDAIFFNDVIEHLYDPAAALQLARNLLKPGGAVIASIPNIRHFPTMWELIVPERMALLR